jgi:hypothetical protein
MIGGYAFSTPNSVKIPIALEELELPIAHFGWLWRREFAGIEFDEVSHVARWFAALHERPAFRRGIARTVALANPSPTRSLPCKHPKPV